MLDADLAELYDVPTRELNQQVQRNRKRFPEDFMFQLAKEEAEVLRSQFVISKEKAGDSRESPAQETQSMDRLLRLLQLLLDQQLREIRNDFPRNLAHDFIRHHLNDTSRDRVDHLGCELIGTQTN
jgi:ORF6N domain-containing protein